MRCRLFEGRLSNLLLVGVDHLQESVMAVVGPLCHVGGDGLIGHDERPSGIDDLAQ